MTSELETYLARLAAELRKRRLPDDRIVVEARGHLTDAVEQGVQRGLSRDAAEREALSRFGAPELVAARFAAERPRMRDRLLFAVRRMLGITLPDDSDTRSVFHDRPARLHFHLKSKRGWVNPELIAVASDPGTQLVPFLERAVPRPLGPLGQVQSVTLLENDTNSHTSIKRYRAVFGTDPTIICTVSLRADGKAVSLDWSKA
jgi:HAAS domain-containing protein